MGSNDKVRHTPSIGGVLIAILRLPAGGHTNAACDVWPVRWLPSQLTPVPNYTAW